MRDEIKAHADNGTWTLVNRPQDIPVVSCKWVYKIKRDNNGKIDKYKARLVARGFTQEYGVNYFETYAPVVRNSSIRLLLALATELDYCVSRSISRTRISTVS